MTGSTSAETATAKSTTPGRRRNASSAERDRLERDEWRCAVEPLDADDPLDMHWIDDPDDEGWTGGENGPEDGEHAPKHDIS